MGIISNMASYNLSQDMFNYKKDVDQYKKQQYESGEAWVNQAEGLEKAGISKNAKFGAPQTAGEMGSASSPGYTGSDSNPFGKIANLMSQQAQYDMTKAQEKLLNQQRNKVIEETSNIKENTLKQQAEKNNLAQATAEGRHNLNLAKKRGLSVGEQLGGGIWSDRLKAGSIVQSEMMKIINQANKPQNPRGGVKQETKIPAGASLLSDIVNMVTDSFAKNPITPQRRKK